MLTHQFIYLFLINVFFTNFALQPLKLYVFTEVLMTETRENMVVSSTNSGDSYTAQEGFFTSLADRAQGTKLSSPDATRLH